MVRLNINGLIWHIKDWKYDVLDRAYEFRYNYFSYYPVINKFLKDTKNIQNITEVWNAWQKAFPKIMKRTFKFNSNASKNMLKWVGDGHNWEKLWYDDNTTWQMDYENFRGDLFYISDRISMDRILRVHYMLGSALYKYKREMEK